MAAAGAAGVAAGGPSEMALASAGTDLGARPRYGREAAPGGPDGPGSGEYVPGHGSGYAGDDGPRKRRLVPLVGAIAAVALIGAAAAVALSGGEDDPDDTGSETTSDTSADTTTAPTPTTEAPVLPSILTAVSTVTVGRSAAGDPANVEGFTFDDEGNLWAAAQEGGFLAEVTDPEGAAEADQIVLTNAEGESARPVTAVNADGSIWAALRRDGSVARVDPESREEILRVDTAESPVFLFAADDGSVYGVAEGPSGDEDNTGYVFHITPDNSLAHEIPLDSPRTLVVDGGDVWVTYGGSLLQRFDADLNTVGGPITVGDGRLGEPSRDTVWSDAVTVAEDGSVWTANRAEGTVSRVDPDAGAVTHTFTVGGEPTDIEMDGGRMWIVDTGDSSAGNREAAGYLSAYDVSGAADLALGTELPEPMVAEVGIRPLDMYIVDSDTIWVSLAHEADNNLVRVDATA
jgi:streptogramin lyase